MRAIETGFLLVKWTIGMVQWFIPVFIVAIAVLMLRYILVLRDFGVAG